ncbi:MAG: F0F1 ATP synthase subunit A [Prevotellaceae bacterium]|jgi:F-type H+-transporting ATPase subunit a|nr:F0F1 ATP synthase subunit A [Prevotellaceae bacterium]
MQAGARIRIFVWLALALLPASLYAATDDGHHPATDKTPAIGDIISEHTADSYWWHITTINGRHISLYLPVIVRSADAGWMAFSSKRLAHGETYRGFRLADEGAYKGKIVGRRADGTEYRPWDISITRNALSILINSAIMLALFLTAARACRRRPKNAAPNKLACIVEMLVMDIEEEVIRKSIGDDYKRYSSYLLTAFFFIFINNVMGLIPVFPGGANTTGNIAVTLVLAACTLIAVNVFGNREYWKEIFWPDVPTWLKAPIPLMPVIELFGVISKPFALMIRLLANIFAGHTVMLALTCVIFITVKMGVGINVGMTAFSVLMTIFMSVIELLVAYIQAYVFTLLSAVFIGLSRPAHHAVKTKKIHTEKV